MHLQLTANSKESGVILLIQLPSRERVSVFPKMSIAIESKISFDVNGAVLAVLAAKITCKELQCSFSVNWDLGIGLMKEIKMSL